MDSSLLPFFQFRNRIKIFISSIILSNLWFFPWVALRKHILIVLFNLTNIFIFLTIFLFPYTVIDDAELIVDCHFVNNFRDLNVCRLNLWLSDLLGSILKASISRIRLWFQGRSILFFIDHRVNDDCIGQLFGLVD